MGRYLLELEVAIYGGMRWKDIVSGWACTMTRWMRDFIGFLISLRTPFALPELAREDGAYAEAVKIEFVLDGEQA